MRATIVLMCAMFLTGIAAGIGVGSALNSPTESTLYEGLYHFSCDKLHDTPILDDENVWGYVAHPMTNDTCYIVLGYTKQ